MVFQLSFSTFILIFSPKAPKIVQPKAIAKAMARQTNAFIVIIINITNNFS